ncbi:AAA family ATPase, partial [Staphylococcus succinus]|uniref:AAA family ATPase n=2 Tax=Staphylococcus succinus TaxID=61015 RepID=UPI000FEED36B
MRPLTLKLNNFGPFLNETIDFDHVKDDQLFLISGKTGSGKTMIFDAIVYALFGEASTKDRKESDLRSHFADSKSPMVVEFEFKLRDDVYKIVRQGAFIKEGNKNKTLGQLTVYQFDNDDYDLKESKINTGNQFIKSQLGVNAEQFRQLFILPQGEFKRFLLSKSSEKQEILRTLFNSQRFEDIQRNLMDDVKEVREKIEKRFSILENNWQDIDAFNDEVLTEFKLINARQTNRVVEVLPKFIEKAKDIQEQLKQRKHQQQDEVKKSEKILDDNINLEHALSKLKEQQAKYDALVLKENDIQSKVKLLNEIYEVRPLANLLDTQETLKIKKTKITQDISNKDQLIRGLVSKIQKDEDMLMMHKKSSQTLEKTREFIERCKLFYDNANKYKKSYQEYDVLKISYNELNENFALQQQQFDTMNAQLNYRNPDYEIIEILNSEIFELKNKVKDLKR